MFLGMSLLWTWFRTVHVAMKPSWSQSSPTPLFKEGQWIRWLCISELLEGQDNRMKKKVVMCLSHCQRVGRIQLVKVHATSKHAPCKLQVSGFTFINVLFAWALETMGHTWVLAPCFLIPDWLLVSRASPCSVAGQVQQAQSHLRFCFGRSAALLVCHSQFCCF